MANSNKKSLSKNLAQMKFMKRRSHDLAAKDLVDPTVGALIEKWIVPGIPPVVDEGVWHGPGHVCVESFVECEELNEFGRFSYNKFNKEVERLSRQYANGQDALTEDQPDDEDGTIPAHEMARRYEEITSKKLLGKRKRSGNVENEIDTYLGSRESKTKAVDKGRHKALQRRVDKMDKKDFLRPS